MNVPEAMVIVPQHLEIDLEKERRKKRRGRREKKRYAGGHLHERDSFSNGTFLPQH